MSLSSLTALASVVLVLGCKSDETTADDAVRDEPAATTPSPLATSKTAAPATTAPKLKAPVYNIPVGPGFAIEPGAGIGPIRFGATLSTIERLMEAPCTEKTETLCRYSIHAVDFHLKDGVLERIHIHGDERQFDANPEHTYGIFNGALPQGVELGMFDHYVRSVLGPPRKEEPAEPGRFQTLRRDIYDGMTLEFDKLKNGNVVLAGIVLTPAKVSKTPAAATGKTRPKP